MRRRTALAVLLAAAALIAAFTLRRVLLTVFLALTVVIVARPLYRWLLDRGIPRYVASALTTLAVFLVVVLVTAPLGYVLYERRSQIEAVLGDLPESIRIDLGEAGYVIETADVQAWLVDQLEALAIDMVAAAPELALELMLFTVIVFGVLLGQTRVAAALEAIVPPGYDDVYDALADRTGRTLRAIYVLQLLTGFATFLIAIPVFYLLGYDLFLTLAVVCGLLQFFPIVGPSIVLVVLAGYHVSAGDPTAAVLVLLLGGVFVAILPDLAVRPYLARTAADMSATLYFVGFVGGLLSLGPIGVIAGPLAVALLAECVSLLAAELRTESEQQTLSAGETDG